MTLLFFFSLVSQVMYSKSPSPLLRSSLSVVVHLISDPCSVFFSTSIVSSLIQIKKK